MEEKILEQPSYRKNISSNGVLHGKGNGRGS